MADLHAIPPRADDNPAPPEPPRFDRYKLIILRCIPYAILAFLGLLMVIFPALSALRSIPYAVLAYLGLLMVIFPALSALMSPEFRFNSISALSSPTISTSHSKLISIEYAHMKLLLSFDGQLALSRPSLVSIFTQGPGYMISIRAKVQSTLAIVTNLGMSGLVSMLNGEEVTVNVAVKVKRRLRLGPWWVAMFDVDVSSPGLTFAAPTDSEGGSNWMILRGNLNCSVDIIPQL